MKDHTVTVDCTENPSAIRFSEVFNCAVPFIDRHLDEGRGDKNAIRTEDGDVTYRELAERVNRCGNALISLGIAPGDRVLMVVKDSPEFFYVMWGAVKAGIIPVPLNTMLRAHDYEFMIEDSACTAIVYSPKFAAEVEPAAKATHHRPAHVIPTEGEGSLITLMAAASAELAPVPTTADDDSFWLYSSGSTGTPKGVVHRHGDSFYTSQYFAVETLGINADDVIFSAPRLFFSYGFGNAMTFPLWVGATVVLTDNVPTPESTFDIIERFRPTVFFGVPTLFAYQLAALDTLKPDLSSIRFAISAGEPLPAELFRGFREKAGITILDGIGSTEVHHIFIANTMADNKPGVTGKPVTGYEVKIVGEDGTPIPQGEIGVLMAKGRSIARYYWNNPEKTAKTMLGDWFHTGDTYYQDEDGYYVYCGRNDDMLKVGGIWCSPAEIEARLVEHPAVLEAAVVGRNDGDGLTKPAAYVVLKDPQVACDGLTGELVDHCKAALARYKYPRWIDFIDELPKTATGKIQRFRLRENA